MSLHLAHAQDKPDELLKLTFTDNSPMGNQGVANSPFKLLEVQVQCPKDTTKTVHTINLVFEGDVTLKEIEISKLPSGTIGKSLFGHQGKVSRHSVQITPVQLKSEETVVLEVNAVVDVVTNNNIPTRKLRVGIAIENSSATGTWMTFTGSNAPIPSEFTLKLSEKTPEGNMGAASGERKELLRVEMYLGTGMMALAGTEMESVIVEFINSDIQASEIRLDMDGYEGRQVESTHSKPGNSSHYIFSTSGGRSWIVNNIDPQMSYINVVVSAKVFAKTTNDTPVRKAKVKLWINGYSVEGKELSFTGSSELK